MSNSGGVAPALAELEKDRARVRAQIERIMNQLRKDPISPLDLRFTEGEGFTSRPIRFQGKILTGTVYLFQQSHVAFDGSWSPPSHRVGAMTWRPVGFMLAPWGLVVALQISHDRADFRPKIEFKKGRAGTGSVFVADPVNHEYLRLVSSSLEGEVVSGIPRTGLLAFERPVAPTDRLQLHFSDLALSPESTSLSNFHFEYAGQDLPANLEEVISGPTPSERAGELLEQEVEKVRREFLRQQSGCAPALIAFFATAAAVQRWILS